jgi:hypothetical protein
MNNAAQPQLKTRSYRPPDSKEWIRQFFPVYFPTKQDI